MSTVAGMVWAGMRTLVEARQSWPPLHGAGTTTVVPSGHQRVFAWLRRHPRFGTMLGVANVGGRTTRLDSSLMTVLGERSVSDVLAPDDTDRMALRVFQMRWLTGDQTYRTEPAPRHVSAADVEPGASAIRGGDGAERIGMNISTTRTRHLLAVAALAPLAAAGLGWNTASATIPSAAAGNPAPTDGTTLYRVDLATGAATAIGSVGDGLGLVGLAIAPSDALRRVYGVTDNGELAAFDATSPRYATVTPITGLGQDAPLLGIDVRPADGSIFALSTGGVVYTIDPASGTATAVGEGIDPTIESPAFGFDFNPTVDRIRVDASSGQNLRLNPDKGAVGTNPDTGQPTIDKTLSFAEADDNAGTPPRVVGAGYTNSVAGAEATQLYVIDAATGSLALQDPPNDGVLNTVGPLGVAISDGSSFDIAPSGEALLAVPADAFGVLAAG